jgi:GT2 family glycosyltransferase/glycosyltransferase involved in cell wall biosynthesis
MRKLFLINLLDLYRNSRERLRRWLPYTFRRHIVEGLRRFGVLPSPPTSFGFQSEAATPRSVLLKATTPNYDVICFPIIDWGFRYQRPQQIMSQFARRSHRVFYLRTQFHAGDSFMAQEIAPHLYQVQLPGPSQLNLYQSEIENSVLAKCLEALADLRQHASIKEAICLVQLPFWTPLAFEARRQWGWKVIYDCIDEHRGFSTNASSMLDEEEKLIQGSDLVTTTSRALYAKVKPQARQTLLIPNATDFNHFNQPATSRPLENLPRPIIGYYGAISEWFDVEMIRVAAVARPNWSFVLIGDTFGANIRRLQALPNLHFLGEKNYLELPAYLQEFDVTCIPFLHTPLTAATNPVKFYEYLSAGKPIVATELPELEPYREFFYPINTPAEFVPQVERALQAETPALVVKRKALAQVNTWETRYQTLATTLPRLYAKASIIIVSYYNFDYLKQCLDSLWAKTIYPNFEVIVVDNGSEPEVVNYLRQLAADEPRLKLILNNANFGFARATNQGVAIATPESEYLVLLNNDTVVTRGWLGGLIHYLQKPEIGLVGPVTNSIGNEAMIPVTYTDLDALESFATAYTDTHCHQIFEISMLAMFCVALRREVFAKIGPLDEQFGLGMFEDDDYTLRVRHAGYQIVCAEDVFIHHWGRASFSQMTAEKYLALFNENRQKFEAKWERPWEPHQARKPLTES